MPPIHKRPLQYSGVLIKCAFYNSLREELYAKIQNYCKNFINFDNKSKCVWLMTTEDIFLVEYLCHFLIQSTFFFLYFKHLIQSTKYAIRLIANGSLNEFKM